MQRTSKRLLALLGGSLGLGAILRRRRRTAPAPSPAAELKAKLAVAKDPEPQPQAEPAPQSPPAPVAAPDTVDERRADAHARARHAIEELGEKSD